MSSPTASKPTFLPPLAAYDDTQPARHAIVNVINDLPGSVSDK
jgi:hypothetical protein